MQAEPTQADTFKRSVWLGVPVGWLAQLGLTSVLPMLVSVALNACSLIIDQSAPFVPDAHYASGPGWLIQEAAIFIGSFLAGCLGMLLSPPRSVKALIVLLVLSVLATGFQQLPQPLSVRIVVIAIAAPNLGLLAGMLVMRWRQRRPIAAVR